MPYPSMHQRYLQDIYYLRACPGSNPCLGFGFCSAGVAERAYRLAMPAFRTAVEMALMAVHKELSRVVSSPVPFAFRPSSRTNLVTVTTLVSKAPRSDMASCRLVQLVPQVWTHRKVAEDQCRSLKGL